MKAFHSVLLITVVLAICVFISCKKDEPVQPHVPTIQLSIEDASCTEAWLKVTLADLNEPRTVAIQQDGQRVPTARMTSLDSLLVVEGLLPLHTYTFLAQRLQQDSTVIDASAAVQATTMDTTSHNFTWHIDTLGVTASSLYDVAIINDTLAYAVGELYLNDSTGQLDPIPYNMVKWNGVSWQLIRIQFYAICGQTNTTPYATGSVFAFGATDVWLTSRGGQLARWNGTTQTATICNPDPFPINKIWGENANSIWAVGYSGRISHYTNGSWQRVESGTSLHLYDIAGAPSSGINQEVYAVGGRYLEGPEHTIIQLNGANVTEMSSAGVPSTLYCLWFQPQRKYFVGGSGLFSKFSTASNSPWADLNATNHFLSSLRGTALNNVVACGAFGEVTHFNGLTWRSYRAITGLVNGRYIATALKGNKVFAVGFDVPKAVVLRGQRQ